MDDETCVHCKERLLPVGTVVVGEWSHWHGDSWCHDKAGFTATPLQRAQPVFHGAGDVL